MRSLFSSLPPGILLISLLGVGCTSTGGWLDRDRGGENATRGIEASDVSGYLRIMRDLAAADPVTKAEVFARVDEAASRAPTTTNRLRLALALATPGHAGADADRARGLLTEILARDELLLPAEKQLAELQLEVVEQWLLLRTENRQLRADNQRTADTARERLQRQLASANAENRRLRQELDEAEEKLRAITTIERSIRERSDADQQR